MPPLDPIPTINQHQTLNFHPSLSHPNKSHVPLTLSATSRAASKPSHGDGLLVRNHVLEERNSALQLPAIDRLRGLTSVLEADAEVGAASASALRAGDVVGSVADLDVRRKGSVSPSSRFLASPFVLTLAGSLERCRSGKNDKIDADGRTHHLDRVVVQKKMAPGYRAVLRRQSQEDKPSVEWPFFLSCVVWLSESGRQCDVALTLVQEWFSAPIRLVSSSGRALTPNLQTHQTREQCSSGRLSFIFVKSMLFSFLV